MERLTRKTKTGNYTTANCTVSIRNVFDKMGEYEDAEEDGLLIRLHCRVGTELFAILNRCRAMDVSEEECDDELYCDKCIYTKQFIITPVLATKEVLTNEFFSKNPTYIWGKTLFATKAEAEQALAKMKGE